MSTVCMSVYVEVCACDEQVYILYLKDSWAFKHSDLFKGACSNHSRSVSSL